jgi:hypothetical protein
MRFFTIGFLSFTLFTSMAFSFEQTHKKWTEVLKNYQTPKGLIKYEKLKKDSAEKKDHPFNTYLSDLESVSFKSYESFSKEEKMAFLINAYNALTVKLIIDNYPVASIKKIGGWFTKPWSIEFFSLLDGKIKALDPIEHEWLRPNFKDYRIHAAVNCASASCPPLRNEAFVAKTLNKQLDSQMLAWLKDQSRNQVSTKSKTWSVSKIFDWYESDFEKWGGGVPKVINKYLKTPLEPEALSKVKLKYLSYDWSLNEAK